MRKATFKIPKAGGDTEDAELAISSAAGGVEANIMRWEGQFGADAKAKTEPRNVNGLKVTVVEIKGKIGGGGMMGMPATAAKDNQMLLGAVVDPDPANAPGPGDPVYPAKNPVQRVAEGVLFALPAGRARHAQGSAACSRSYSSRGGAGGGPATSATVDLVGGAGRALRAIVVHRGWSSPGAADRFGTATDLSSCRTQGEFMNRDSDWHVDVEPGP
jgi:hypothetical protein